MKNKHILVLGSGFIGNQVQAALGCRSSNELIHTFDDALAIVKKTKPSIIVNCIGETGKRNVDDCELDKQKTLHANTIIPMILADIAYRLKIKLVHISSGCIFHYDYHKDHPISEKKEPDYFKLFYSRTKIYAERVLRSFGNKADILVVRIRVPLDNKPHPKNLLTKLMHFKRIIDVPNSVTYIPDFLQALSHLIRIGATGIYNVVAKGALRYPLLLDEYKKHRADFSYSIIPYNKFKFERTNLVLSTRKLEKTGFQVRSIKEIVPECVEQYLKY